MTTTVGEAGRRRRSEKKRNAILDAAQELFVADGYELTSVDAIAARADVSKRTVYDHFGDKEGIHAAVVDRVASRLLGTVRLALEEELGPGCDPKVGLLSFARRVATETFPSSDYVEFRHLAARGTARRRVPGSTRNAPKELFTERITAFAEAGILRTANPRRAAEHYIALTFLLALDTLDPTTSGGWDAIDAILVDGVAAFLRAYT
ncbi:TetR/AcrR family transcriptional regulator [Mycolicibacterium sp.]|uniref:TetR/AcrR family transcriptional regulator n=1 Tax=Mycolicibacterium sp. TaxID=2320850 RepID=UPI003D0BCAD2